MTLTLLLFAIGLTLVVFCAEKLVEGVVGTSLGFGVSAFLISVVFVGFDPENLALGATASYEQAFGIALGTVFGAAMVAIALAFGITALLAPMSFDRAPARVVAVPVVAILLLGVLGYDGLLSRLDGVLLFLTFIASIVYLVRLSRQGLDIRPTGEVAETLEKDRPPGRWKSVGLLALTITGIIAGSELLVSSSEHLIAELGFSETTFGMTILALVVSIEELARELPPALKGRPEISYGNVLGSILAFFLCNAGIIAMVHPVPVNDSILRFHFPLTLATVAVISVFMLRRTIPRWAGGLLIGLYILFFGGSYFL